MSCGAPAGGASAAGDAPAANPWASSPAPAVAALGVPTAVLAPPGDSAHSPVRKRRRIWWLVGGLALVVAVGVGVTVLAVRQVTSVSGAASPEAAVIGLVQAVNDKDLVRAATLLPPDELAQLGEVLTSAGNALTRTGVVDTGAGDGDFATMLSGLNVSVRGLQVHSELVEPDLALVTVVAGTLDAAVEPADTTGLLHTALANSDIAATGASFSLNIDDVNATQDRPVMVAAVQRDGGWYVSPLYTAGEYLLRSTGAIRAPVSASEGQQKTFDTPEAAAQGLLDQVGAAVNSRHSAGLAEGLAPAEAAAVLTYRRGIDELIANLKVHVQDWDAGFDVVEQTGDTAVVRPTLITINGDDGRNSGTIEIQDGCLIFNGDNRGCVADGGNEQALNELLLGTNPDFEPDLVVKRVGDGWRVSLSATAAHNVKKVLENVSPSQARYVVARFLSDRHARAQALTGLPSDQQVGLDQEITLDFGDSEVFKVVDVVVEPGQVLAYQDHPALSESCLLGGIYSADGTELSEIDAPGTYRLVAFAVVQNDDGYYRNVHADSCAIRMASR